MRETGREIPNLVLASRTWREREIEREKATHTTHTHTHTLTESQRVSE